MTYTEAYKEHIVYTFHSFCKVVIRHAAITAWRDQHRRQQKEISLEYLTEEKFYTLGTTDEYFEAPYEEHLSPTRTAGRTMRAGHTFPKSALRNFCSNKLLPSLNPLPHR